MPGNSANTPDAYGRAFADVYDAWYSDISDVAATVEAIARFADLGRVLELGVGTGRIAIPLAQAGVDVVGIDASAEMLMVLRAKPGSERVHAIRSDMSSPAVKGPFTVAFVAFNTFFNITTEPDQHRCLLNVANALDPGGRFVVEAFVPSPEPSGPQRGVSSRPDGAGGSVYTTTLRDPETQTVDAISVHTTAAGESVERPWTIRYLHPEQMDQMAAGAGLVLEHRWASFAGEAYDPLGDRHVSVYRRPLDR